MTNGLLQDLCGLQPGVLLKRNEHDAMLYLNVDEVKLKIRFVDEAHGLNVILTAFEQLTILGKYVLILFGYNYCIVEVIMAVGLDKRGTYEATHS